MDCEELLKEAINSRKPIEFEYNRGDKIRCKRIGNPHILFIGTGTGKPMIHIFQTGGVSDTNLNEGLPWRLFFAEFIENVKILNENPSFEIAEGYNPDNSMYINTIAKI